MLWAQSILFSMKGTFFWILILIPAVFFVYMVRGLFYFPTLPSLQSCSFVDFQLQISHLGGLAGPFLFLSFLLLFQFSLACRVLTSGWFIHEVGFGEVEFRFIGWFCISSDNLDARILIFCGFKGLKCVKRILRLFSHDLLR